MIDLRSDTLTQPTPQMRRAIADAEVGDEQKREDPTVIALEERGAELLGHEEAVFLPTATMANQIALRTLTEPGDEVLAEEMAHVFRYELGGPAVHSGLVMKSLPTTHGIFSAEDVREAVNPPGDLHTAPTKLVCGYLACNDRSWQVRCGIESYFLPQDEAAETERLLADGAVAEVRIDGRGNAAVVDVRAP